MCRLVMLSCLCGCLTAAVLGPDASDRPAILAVAAEAAHAATIAQVRPAAKAALIAEPQAPATLHYEGLLHTDPRRQATVAALSDLSHMAALHRAWLIDGESRHAAQAERFIAAWIRREPTANPINEAKLWSLLRAEDALRPEGLRHAYETWLRRLAEYQRGFLADRSRDMNNWHAKAMLLELAAGLRLRDPELVADAVAAFKRLVATALCPDGSSVEIEKRDALSYHVGALKPMLEFALLARRGGLPEDLYRYAAPDGSSLARSVAYVEPYARGEKVYEQWRKTTVELDRRRAAAGIPEYQPGFPYDSRRSRPLAVGGWLDLDQGGRGDLRSRGRAAPRPGGH